MIKWFDSKMMTGIPELTNVQGDLVKMLNGLLVNGVNSKPVSTVNYSNNLCTLEVGANHGFVRHSVICIQGSSQPNFIGREFRVEDISISTISFRCGTVNSEVGLSVKYAPLGFEQHFASEGRACYKSNNPKYPAYLRVDDTKLSGTSVDAAKFATVEICSDMTDFNSAAWQSPYDSSRPLKNRATIAGSNGWFKWYYASAKYTQSDTNTSPEGVREYMLVGDESYFWLVIYPYGASAADGAVYGFARANYGVDDSQVLIATNSLPEVAASGNYPHISFVSSGADGSVAPMYKQLSFAIPSLLSLATNTGGNISFASINPLVAGNVFLKNPVYLFYSEVLAEFVGISTTNHKNNGVLFAGNKSYKTADIKQVYNIAFDLE